MGAGEWPSLSGLKEGSKVCLTSSFTLKPGKVKEGPFHLVADTAKIQEDTKPPASVSKFHEDIVTLSSSDCRHGGLGSFFSISE